MRITELIRSRRRSLTRYAHKLARSGRHENAEAVISEIRGHQDFDPASHEAAAFRAALNAICNVAKSKHSGKWQKPPRGLRRPEQQTAIAA